MSFANFAAVIIACGALAGFGGDQPERRETVPAAPPMLEAPAPPAAAWLLWLPGTTARHPIVHQRSIADWFKPAADPAIPVADTVDMPDRITRCIYTDRWTNPSPDKEIRSLAVEATGGAVLVIVAVSGEQP